MLVNAANLVVFYMGWEIVGICSFLLVGFWYADPLKNEAAKKVFFFTHIPGEALLLFAIGAYAWTGSLNINALLTSTPAAWQMNTLLASRSSPYSPSLRKCRSSRGCPAQCKAPHQFLRCSQRCNGPRRCVSRRKTFSVATAAGPGCSPSSADSRWCWPLPSQCALTT